VPFPYAIHDLVIIEIPITLIAWVHFRPCRIDVSVLISLTLFDAVVFVIVYLEVLPDIDFSERDSHCLLSFQLFQCALAHCHARALFLRIATSA
jgi:hypothetical protein